MWHQRDETKVTIFFKLKHNLIDRELDGKGRLRPESPGKLWYGKTTPQKSDEIGTLDSYSSINVVTDTSEKNQTRPVKTS